MTTNGCGEDFFSGGPAGGPCHYYPSEAVSVPPGCRATVVVGPRGCGRTSAAREIARRRGAGWVPREFGKQDYLGLRGFRRALRALAARDGGGLLVQIGATAGTVAIFDDTDTAPREVQRAVVAFLAQPPPSLAVVCVVTALAGLPGLRWRIQSSGVHVVRLGRPTDDQVRRVLGADTAPPPPAARADFRALLALRAAARAPEDASSGLVAGHGTRDTVWSDRAPHDLAQEVLEERDPARRERAAGCAPLTVGMIYADNATKLLPDRARRVEYARLLRFSTLCRSVAFDDTAQQFALCTGTLAIPMLRGGDTKKRTRRRTKPTKLAPQKKSLTLSLQARYNNATRHVARSSMGKQPSPSRKRTKK